MENRKSTFKGFVQRQKIYPQSRSERLGYVLYVSPNNFLPLEIQGRDPFQHEAFKPFDGHFVTVEGHQAGDSIVASQIQSEHNRDLVWKIEYNKARICPFCGSTLSDDIQEFCPICGYRL